MDLPLSDWRYRLEGDPTRWLLEESDNPSVFFWFLRDIVGRPEDSPSLIDTRDKILYSDPVQAIFAHQDVSGFWESPNSLDLPRYSSTLWMLALLAELGIPRSSRRAAQVCEFVLQNHVNSDGAFTGLRDPGAAGLLASTLQYFRRGDARMGPILDRLISDARNGDVCALAALVISREYKYAQPIREGRERLVEAVARGAFPVFGAFPSYEGGDLLLALRVLRTLGAIGDFRLAPAIESIWKRQLEGARWSLQIDYSDLLPCRFEPAGSPSKWATLNVLRVVTATIAPANSG